MYKKTFILSAITLASVSLASCAMFQNHYGATQSEHASVCHQISQQISFGPQVNQANGTVYTSTQKAELYRQYRKFECAKYKDND